MAIVKMSRFTLTAFKADKEQILRRLQSLSDVCFTDLTEPPPEPEQGVEVDPDKPVRPYLLELEGVESDHSGTAVTEVNERLQKVAWCIDILSEVKTKPKGLAGFNNALPEIPYDECEERAAALDLQPVYRQIRATRDKINENKDKIRNLKETNRMLLHYQKLDIPFGRLKETRHCRVLTGYIPKRWRQAFEEALVEAELTYVEVLSVDEQNVYLLIISEPADERLLNEALRLNAFTRESIPEKYSPGDMIKYNQERIKEAEADIGSLNAELKQISDSHLDDLKLLYESIHNEAVRVESRDNFVRTDRIVIIEGYVPTEIENELKATIQGAIPSGVYGLEVAPVGRDDDFVEDVPVMLRNNGLVKPFESIVSTYSTPRYNEIDPTPLMMPWYCLSFGMMMGDLGYGLVIFLLTTIILKVLKLKSGTRNFLRFFQILSIPTMIAGACFGSFFSVDTPWPAIIVPTQDYMTMLILSVAIGFVMLMFGLGVKAYMFIRDGDPLGAVYDVLFWYMTLGGILVLLLQGTMGLPPVAGTIATVCMVIGLIGILLFSARENKTMGPRLGWGFYNVYGITSWIGDLVSYTRIAALMLSGGFIGYAINLISGGLMGSVVGFIAAIIILVVFHAFNLFLSGLSGYVHTMRLVYVEYFGKFFEGGGRAFKRYRADSVHMDVK